jgi:hypothetical protein
MTFPTQDRKHMTKREPFLRGLYTLCKEGENFGIEFMRANTKELKEGR